MYEIQKTEYHGLALVATERMDPGPQGLVVFREEALLVIPTRGSEQDVSGPPPTILDRFDPQIWTDWCFFRTQPTSLKQKILGMYTEMDCLHAVWLMDYLTKKVQLKEEEKIDDQEFDGSILSNIEEFVRFTMVIRFNSVEMQPPSEDGSGPGTDYGHALFETACKMSHSCKPNCVWHTTLDGRHKEVRAIATIEKGDELTIDYVGNKLDPIITRRALLLQSKGFLCKCNRCAAINGDDTRRFKCINSATTGCHGVHFLHQPMASDSPELLPCTYCGTKSTEAYKDVQLKNESSLADEINELDRIACEGRRLDVSERIERLNPPHDLHSLADKCYMIQGELYSQRGDYRSAAAAYSKQIECRFAILGDDYYNESTAFCLERLGDVLKHINLAEAEEAYKRVVRTLQMMRGLDPYSQCAITKLLDVQSRRATVQNEILEKDSLHGIASHRSGPPTTDFPCELCGNASCVKSECSMRVNYCCEDHLRVHGSFMHDSKLFRKTCA